MCTGTPTIRVGLSRSGYASRPTGRPSDRPRRDPRCPADIRRRACHAEEDRHLGTDLQPHVVGFQSGGGIHRRRPTKSDEDFRARRWKALAGSDVEGNSLPAPRIDLQPQSRKRLHLGVRRDALFRPVAAELTPDDVFLTYRRDCLQDLDLLVPNGFAVRPDRRLDGQVGHHLEQMILDHVADGTGRRRRSRGAGRRNPPPW